MQHESVNPSHGYNARFRNREESSSMCALVAQPSRQARTPALHLTPVHEFKGRTIVSAEICSMNSVAAVGLIDPPPVRISEKFLSREFAAGSYVAPREGYLALSNICLLKVWNSLGSVPE